MLVDGPEDHSDGSIRRIDIVIDRRDYAGVGGRVGRRSRQRAREAMGAYGER